jgi:ketosteroid isomerase-like protein
MPSPNVELARSLFVPWQRGDYSSTDWADPEIEFVMGDVFPDPGVYRGVEEMTHAWVRFFATWEGFRFDEPELVDLGGRVVGLYTIRGRGKSSGAEVEAHVANALTFRDGKVVRLELLSREAALRMVAEERE